jgi:hypothetical protein
MDRSDVVGVSSFQLFKQPLRSSQTLRASRRLQARGGHHPVEHLSVKEVIVYLFASLTYLFLLPFTGLTSLSAKVRGTATKLREVDTAETTVLTTKTAEVGCVVILERLVLLILVNPLRP